MYIVMNGKMNGSPDANHSILIAGDTATATKTGERDWTVPGDGYRIGDVCKIERLEDAIRECEAEAAKMYDEEGILIERPVHVVELPLQIRQPSETDRDYRSHFPAGFVDPSLTVVYTAERFRETAAAE